MKWNIKMSEETLLLCSKQVTADIDSTHYSETVSRMKPKILVVEDNLLNQKVARIFLEDMGYAVDIAENGQKAIAMFNTTYAAILMDIGLPDMDGCDVCVAIRKLDHGKDIPIIALTASGEYFKERCLDVGMDSYLTKPIMIEDLKKQLTIYVPLE